MSFRLYLGPTLLALALAACADLTAPTRKPGGGKLKRADSPATAEVAPGPAHQQPKQQARAPSQAAKQQIAASHILIAHKDARRSRATRSKEEARRLAEQVLAQAKRGGDFAKLAQEHSDDPGSKGRGGSLGRFGRRSMVKPFADAAFALQPGQLSGVVETAFGYHIIKRTE